jgi:1-acyl-sn-glycerol-3-phosphate acyltransferase
VERLRQAIQDVAVDLLGTPADDVVLAPPNAVPKTSSGKIRRAASREVYESGRIGKGGSGLGLQVARLAASGLRAQAARRLRSAGDVLYALRFYLVVTLLALPIWTAAVLAPGLARRRRIARGAARLLLRCAGIPARIEGLEHLAGERPCIVAANHQSYLDGFVLTALLPPGFAYVVKREMEGSFLPRTLLRRLGTLFVERFDASQGAGETRKALEAVRAGESLVIFPEGTFRRYPGLLPFRMGTFAVAVDAGVPVVPVAIQGTRGIFRGDTFFPRRGEISVAVLPPAVPGGSGWHAGLQLRDAVRAGILTHCGEPDLT